MNTAATETMHATGRARVTAVSHHNRYGAGDLRLDID
jgi:hypothetical protein